MGSFSGSVHACLYPRAFTHARMGVALRTTNPCRRSRSINWDSPRDAYGGCRRALWSLPTGTDLVDVTWTSAFPNQRRHLLRFTPTQQVYFLVNSTFTWTAGTPTPKMSGTLEIIWPNGEDPWFRRPFLRGEAQRAVAPYGKRCRRRGRGDTLRRLSSEYADLSSRYQGQQCRRRHGPGL